MHYNKFGCHNDEKFIDLKALATGATVLACYSLLQHDSYFNDHLKNILWREAKYCRDNYPSNVFIHVVCIDSLLFIRKDKALLLVPNERTLVYPVTAAISMNPGLRTEPSLELPQIKPHILTEKPAKNLLNISICTMKNAIPRTCQRTT